MARRAADAYGGTGSISATDGSVNLNSSCARADGPCTYVSASGWAGSATVGYGGSGGSGYGGDADIQALAYPGNIEVPASAGTITGGDAIVASTGRGGAGGSGNADIAAGAGGDGVGGSASLLVYVDGASLSLGTVGVLADGFGGVGGESVSQTGGNGGTGYGGYVAVNVYDPYATGATTGSATFSGL